MWASQKGCASVYHHHHHILYVSYWTIITGTSFLRHTHMHSTQFLRPPPHGATTIHFLKSILVAPHGGGFRTSFCQSYFWLDVSFCFQWHQDLLLAWGWVFSTRVLDLGLLPHPNGCVSDGRLVIIWPGIEPGSSAQYASKLTTTPTPPETCLGCNRLFCSQ
jgi:hypothetical protein